MKPKLIVSGAAGRMGRRIISIATDEQKFDIIAAIEEKNHPDSGTDAGQLAGGKVINIPISDCYPDSCDVLIDFSQSSAADQNIDYCLANNVALVMGTTGLNDAQQQKIKAACQKIPLIYGTNMSVGMNVLFSLVGKAAQMLGENYDIEIVEQHHRFKKDAPSGSALTLAENIAKATNRKFPDCIANGRQGTETQRKPNEIGIHAVRAGDITGLHSVIYSTLGETVTLEHSAHNRDGFARGALRAAEWLVGKKPGAYTMAQVLGIE